LKKVGISLLEIDRTSSRIVYKETNLIIMGTKEDNMKSRIIL